MSAEAYEPIQIRTAGNHVEIDGLNQADVSAAIDLYQAVVQRQVEARADLSAQVNKAFAEQNLDLISGESQKQVIQNVALRERLLKEEGFLTYASLAELRDSTEKAARTWVARQRDRKELFTVEIRGRTLIPQVQLTSAGDVDPSIAELTRPLLTSGLGGWSLWAWLTNPTGRLSGEVPAKLVRTDMARTHRAAQRYASELRLAQGADS
ncbi:hypothetical protein [Brevibacterium oceani]|uniref:hypothetical protein n=1 Tax=Brevibacterium oceani TaxID=358099 RepID=UPI0015E6E0F8|nr:hypothetical protein [Brevibacterium oceani]